MFVRARTPTPIRALFHRYKKILLDIYPPHLQSAPEHDAPPNTYSVPPAVAKPWPHRGEGGDAATIVDHWLATVSKLLRSLKQCGPDEKETPAALSFRLVKKAFRIKFSKQHRGESNPGKEEMGGGRALRVRRTTKIAADSQLSGGRYAKSCKFTELTAHILADLTFAFLTQGADPARCVACFRPSSCVAFLRPTHAPLALY